jgi:hypothetical protein
MLPIIGEANVHWACCEGVGPRSGGRENLRPFAEIGELRLGFLLLLQSFLIGTGVAFRLLGC